MTYYLLIGDEYIEAGTLSFNKFYPDQTTFQILIKMIDDENNLDKKLIVDEKNQSYTVAEFLDYITKNYKIVT